MTCTKSMSRSRTSKGTALLAVALLAAGVFAAEPGAAASGSEARATIEVVINKALAVLRDRALSEDEKQRRIEVIATERFDFERISKLVLARTWKKLSPDQRSDFEAEFRRHLSMTYGRRLSGFSEEDVQVGGVLDHSNGDVTVKTLIVGGEADGVTMNYRMRERDGDWLAIDVVIEGVSMIANFRSQVQEIVSQRGAAGLIEALREKNDRDAQQGSSSG